MPRQPRLNAPGALHHVIGRGIEGTDIYRGREDRKDFLKPLGSLSKGGGIRIYAWALLDTHFHLLVRSGNQSLSQTMRRLLTGYVVNFNRRHKRYGHLFQNRRGDRRRPVARARKPFCHLAKEAGYSGAAVARYLEVTTALVNLYARSFEEKG